MHGTPPSPRTSTSPSHTLTCLSSLSPFPTRAFSSDSSSSAPGILIWADHDGKALHGSVLNVLTAAKQISSSAPITLLITGHHIDTVAQQAAALPVAAVLTVDAEAYDHQLPEPTAAVIVDCLRSSPFSHFLVATTSNAKNLLGRIGAGLDAEPITDVIAVQSADSFTRPIYAGNALATVQLLDKIKLLSIRPTNFDKLTTPSSSSPLTPTPYTPSSSLPPASSPPLSRWVRDDLTTSSRPDLSSARIVVSGGRGLKSADNFPLLERMADLLGGAVGASRAAVDAGMVPNEYQVGQTGRWWRRSCTSRWASAVRSSTWRV